MKKYSIFQLLLHITITIQKSLKKRRPSSILKSSLMFLHCTFSFLNENNIQKMDVVSWIDALCNKENLCFLFWCWLHFYRKMSCNERMNSRIASKHKQDIYEKNICLLYRKWKSSSSECFISSDITTLRNCCFASQKIAVL